MNFLNSIAKKSTFVILVTLFSAISVSALSTVTTKKPLNETTGNLVYQNIIVTITAKSVILDWNTASEHSNGYFEVERSTNQTDFKTIALVLDGFAAEEGTGKKYAFKEDASKVRNGHVVYYRLKQFDEHGNVSYSAIVKVP
jgi:hypothetical protein